MGSQLVVIGSSLSCGLFREYLVNLVQRQRVPEWDPLLDAGAAWHSARGADFGRFLFGAGGLLLESLQAPSQFATRREAG
jgi:hypothetical protein